MINDFKEFLADVDKGIQGKNFGIPTGFKVLDSYTNGIQKSIYTLIGGMSGTGKTSYVDMAYVLNPYDWLQKNSDKTDFKLHVLYNSMERNTKYKLAKWTCLKLYNDFKIILDVPTLLGWQGAKFQVNPELRTKIRDCEEYFEKMSDCVTIYSGADNPTGVYNKISKFALENGKIVEIDEYHKKYIPNDDNLIVLIINDHIGKYKSEGRNGNKFSDKELLDKASEYMGISRDFYGFSPVDISQFNRALGDIDRFKNKDLSPEPSDWKGSSDMYENCDLAIGLFNPYKLKVDDFMGYDIKKMVSSNGENRFRSVSVVKNTYGPDDVIIGNCFIGENGMFKELPDPNKMTEQIYNSIKNIKM